MPVKNVTSIISNALLMFGCLNHAVQLVFARFSPFKLSLIYLNNDKTLQLK